MAIKLFGRIIGRLDKIRIYYFTGAILFRYSIIEEWVGNSLGYQIFISDNGDSKQIKDFTDKFRSLSFGQKIQYLRGSDVLRGEQIFISHNQTSEANLDIYKQCPEYVRLMSELERICKERNQFIHTSYFQGSGVQDWKIRFSSWRPKKKNGELVNEVITPELMKSKYEGVMRDWKLVQKLSTELRICFVKRVQAHETC